MPYTALRKLCAGAIIYTVIFPSLSPAVRVKGRTRKDGVPVKKGLILEGGAMRGLFTAGVMDVFMENGIAFDGAIGVSAGAAFGCNYKSGQIGRVLRYNVHYCQDRRYCSLSSLLRTGDLYSADFCYGTVPLELDPFDFDAYDKNPMDFYVVCTDIETGCPVYHKYTGRYDHGFDWIRASASMPLVSRTVEIGSLKLLDGGISDSIPARRFRTMGYDRCVAVLTRPLGYRKEPNPLMPLIRARYRRYPRLIDALERRHVMYNSQLDYVAAEEQAGRLLVIRPEKPLPMDRVERDPDKLRMAYRAGRDAARARLGEVRGYLAENAGD